MLDMQPEPRQPELTWQAQEVLREIDRRPHLMVRITVRGAVFPHRAMGPFLRIVTGESAVFPWFTEVSGDSSALVGYFPADLPEEGVIEYTYPGEAPRRVRARFTPGPVKRLERARLPHDVVEVTREMVAGKRRLPADRVP